MQINKNGVESEIGQTLTLLNLDSIDEWSWFERFA